MKKKKSLECFTLAELKVLREEVIASKTKEELLERVDSIIASRELKISESLNARFSVDWFNIDPDYISLLHNNGIDTLAQLRQIEDVRELKGITEHGYEQISWAREFFNMEPVEQLPEKKRSDIDEVAKVIVKHSKEVGGTYGRK